MRHIFFITGTIDELADEGSGGVASVFSLVASRFAQKKCFAVGILSLYRGTRDSHFVFDEKIDKSYLQTTLVHRSNFNLLKKSVFWSVITIKLARYVWGLTATSKEKVTLVSVPPFISIVLICLKIFLKFRLVVWELASFRVYSPILTAIRRRSYKYADKVVVTSRQDYEYLSSQNIECELIFNSIDVRTTGLLSAGRPKVDLSDRPVLLAAGRLVPQKGFDRLVEVIDILVNQLTQKNFKLLIVGSGPDRAQIVKVIIERGLSSFIELVPFTTNISSFYANADIFVLTSRFEGLPMVLLESQAFGVPAVAFDCLTGPREVISNGQNGYLVTDGDSESFAKTLTFLISNPDERRRLSAGALAAAKQFNLDDAMVKWFQIAS
jgi:amylovoran biosynthesis glycosyltransferase AmsD